MPGSIFQLLTHSLTTLSFVACDLVRLLVLVSRSRPAVATENLFLRKQLALFQGPTNSPDDAKFEKRARWVSFHNSDGYISQKARILLLRGSFMNLTSKANLGPVASKILAFAVIGLMCHVVPAQSQIISAQYAVAKHESIQTSNHLQVTPAVQRAQASRLETVTSQPIAWYKNKHWWKKHAPIIGGAAGGALIGGLAGGGKGVIIGGAAGAGGGYLYKRLRHHHDYHHQ